MGEPLQDADEIAVWATLANTHCGDWMTADELAAVASAVGGQRVTWSAVAAIVVKASGDGWVDRLRVKRTGEPQRYAYTLNDRGRERAQKLLDAARATVRPLRPGRGDDAEDLVG